MRPWNIVERITRFVDNKPGDVTRIVHVICIFDRVRQNITGYLSGGIITRGDRTQKRRFGRKQATKPTIVIIRHNMGHHSHRDHRFPEIGSCSSLVCCTIHNTRVSLYMRNRCRRRRREEEKCT